MTSAQKELIIRMRERLQAAPAKTVLQVLITNTKEAMSVSLVNLVLTIQAKERLNA